MTLFTDRSQLWFLLGGSAAALAIVAACTLTVCSVRTENPCRAVFGGPNDFARRRWIGECAAHRPLVECVVDADKMGCTQ